MAQEKDLNNPLIKKKIIEGKEMKAASKIGFTLLFFILLFTLLIPREANAQLQLPPGVRREETIIYDPMNARFVNPYMRNWYSPATGAGQREPYHALLYDYLWDINTTTGEFINVLARAPPEELAPYDGTRWRIYLREGIYWTDGVEFTAEDVVFTLKLLNGTPGLNGHDFVRGILKDVTIVDKYTVDLTFKRPFVKLQEGWFASVLLFGVASLHHCQNIYGRKLKTQLLSKTHIPLAPEHMWLKTLIQMVTGFSLREEKIGGGPQLDSYSESLNQNGFWQYIMVQKRRKSWL